MKKLYKGLIALAVAIVVVILLSILNNHIDHDIEFVVGWFGCWAYFAVFLWLDGYFKPDEESSPLPVGDFEIEKVLIVSTGHVSHPEFLAMTADDELPYRAIDHEYGVLLILVDHDDIGESVEADSYMRTHFPHLLTVVNFARERGCKYINFDQDGIQYEELPIYDW